MGSEQKAKLGPGAYGILFEINEQLSVPTGKLDVGPYAAGWYAYIGSAMNGISGRFTHHLGDTLVRDDHFRRDKRYCRETNPGADC